MKDNINLWFVDSGKNKRVPQVFSKVLLNFMLGRYPTSVFEKFSRHRLEYILEELLTKITSKNFFSELKPIWWPDSIEFIPIPILCEKIEKNTLTWILHLQELLLRAREFYADQLYLSRRSCKSFNIIKMNKQMDAFDKTKKSKGDAKTNMKKSKCFIKISPSIFKPIRNENCHPNIHMSAHVKPMSYINCFTNMKPLALCDDVSKKATIDRHIRTHKKLINSFRTSFVQLDHLFKKTPVYIPTSVTRLENSSWKPFVYLDDILRRQSIKKSLDLSLYRSNNCRIEVSDILQPIIPASIEKESYMSKLGLAVTSTTTCQKKNVPRTVEYKKYSPSVPFSSIGGQLIIESLKERYRYNSNYERTERRGCSINDPLRQKDQDKTLNNEESCFTQEKKIRSYHIYKFCRRRPLNSTVLPVKIRNQYCRTMTVNVMRLNSDILKSCIKDCKVILPRIVFHDANDLRSIVRI